MQAVQVSGDAHSTQLLGQATHDDDDEPAVP